METYQSTLTGETGIGQASGVADSEIQTYPRIRFCQYFHSAAQNCQPNPIAPGKRAFRRLCPS